MNEKLKEAGKKGGDRRWTIHYGKSRLQILLELSKKVDKELHNKLMKWPTNHLIELLKISK